VCGDDPGAASALASCGAPGECYGEADDADWRIAEWRPDGPSSRFQLSHLGASTTVEVPMAGRHNARNAAAALVAARLAGVSLDDGAAALRRFGGVGRRLEMRGREAGVTFVDDYAHLPGEVASVLVAAREGLARGRLVCVFQPHRYSRTQALASSFADSFVAADLLAVTDVYPAFEAPRPGVDGMLVVRSVLDAHASQQVAYLPGLGDVRRWLVRTLRPGDVCLTLGAGDLTTVPDLVMADLSGSARAR
jgi:UDP-N-acetylmuramate--alanine ligase